MTARRMAVPAVFDPAQQRRRGLIGKVHVAKTQLRIDDELYRDVLFDVVGKRSAADCTEAELVQLVKHFESRGFTAKAKGGGPKPSDKPFALKARAMWISLHQLGVIENPSDQALEAFAARQLKVAKMQWADEGLSYRLIEGLKKMAERAGWSQDLKGIAPNARVIVLKRRLVEALMAKLWQGDHVPLDWNVNDAAAELAGLDVDLLFATASQLDLVAVAFGRKLRGEMA